MKAPKSQRATSEALAAEKARPVGTTLSNSSSVIKISSPVDANWPLKRKSRKKQTFPASLATWRPAPCSLIRKMADSSLRRKSCRRKSLRRTQKDRVSSRRASSWSTWPKYKGRRARKAPPARKRPNLRGSECCRRKITIKHSWIGLKVRRIWMSTQWQKYYKGHKVAQ